MARSKRTKLPSANKVEYDRLRRNIIARMRYREKQGFKVDYTTKPELKSKPTKRDIERLTKYKVGLNKYGEVIADKPRSKAITQTSFRGVKPSELYPQNTQATIPQGKQKQLDIDYLGMIYGSLQEIYKRGNSLTYDEIGHGVSDRRLLALMTAWKEGYDRLDKTIDAQVEKHGEQKVNEYYKKRFNDISTAIAKALEMYLSDEDEVTYQIDKIEPLLIVP